MIIDNIRVFYISLNLLLFSDISLFNILVMSLIDELILFNLLSRLSSSILFNYSSLTILLFIFSSNNISASVARSDFSLDLVSANSDLIWLISSSLTGSFESILDLLVETLFSRLLIFVLIFSIESFSCDLKTSISWLLVVLLDEFFKFVISVFNLSIAMFWVSWLSTKCLTSSYCFSNAWIAMFCFSSFSTSSFSFWISSS